jgi:hypothetical protein
MFDLASDMDNCFLSSGFEETVKFIRGSDSTASDGTAVSAIVYRDSESLMPINNAGGNFNQVRHYDIQVYLSRTDVPSVKPSYDKIKCLERPGDSSSKMFTVGKIIRMDEGAFRLGLM